MKVTLSAKAVRYYEKHLRPFAGDPALYCNPAYQGLAVVANGGSPLAFVTNGRCAKFVHPAIVGIALENVGKYDRMLITSEALARVTEDATFDVGSTSYVPPTAEDPAVYAPPGRRKTPTLHLPNVIAFAKFVAPFGEQSDETRKRAHHRALIDHSKESGFVKKENEARKAAAAAENAERKAILAKNAAIKKANLGRTRAERAPLWVVPKVARAEVKRLPRPSAPPRNREICFRFAPGRKLQVRAGEVWPAKWVDVPVTLATVHPSVSLPEEPIAVSGYLLAAACKMFASGPAATLTMPLETTGGPYVLAPAQGAWEADPRLAWEQTLIMPLRPAKQPAVLPAPDLERTHR